MDALHFRQADLVDLPRRQIGGGLPADAEGIGGFAVRQGLRGHGLAAGREIGLRQVVVQLAEGWGQGGDVKRFGAPGQPRALGVRKTCRKLREGQEQRAGQRLGGNQLRNLLRQIAQGGPRRGVAALQSFVQQRQVLFDGVGQGLQAREDVFVIGNRLVRHEGHSARCPRSDAPHLGHGHPQVVLHHALERHGVVAVLQPLFRRLQDLPVQVVIHALARGQRFPRKCSHLSQAFVQMLLAPRDALRRIIRPAAVLPGETNACGHLRGFGHPALPVFVEVGAEFAGGFLRRVRAATLRLRRAGPRQGQQPARDRQRQNELFPHHDCLPAPLVNSFSRSAASRTMSRAVSSTSMAVLSTSTASCARTSGETLRSRSRRSRS